MNNKCIFTYITGGYDNLIEPTVITPEWDYICFTDNPTAMKTARNSVWNIFPIHEKDMKIKCPKRRGNAVVMQYHKYLSEQYDTCIIVDGNIRIHTNLDEFLNSMNYDNNIYDLLVPKHPDRDCIYTEAKAIVRLNKDSSTNINKHVNELKKRKYPQKYGLHATSTFVLNMKSHNLKTLFDEWYKSYFEFSSKRDQMTFDYARWVLENKHGIGINICYCPYFANKHPRGIYDTLFERNRHTKRVIN